MSIYEIGIIIYLLAWITALVDIIRSKFKKDIYVLLWLLAIFLVHPAGVVGYFLFGWRHKIDCKKNSSS